MREPFLSVMLIFVTVALGMVAYLSDQDDSALRVEQGGIGSRFGCTDEYPIPARDSTGVAHCYKREACSLWGRPSCANLTPLPLYLTAWDELEARRSAAESRRITFTVLAVSLGYGLVGWHLHSLILALLLRFLLPKWALLAALVADVMTINVVGGVRAIVGLLQLPPRQAERSESQS